MPSSTLSSAFPIEIYRAILQFCDPSTLAATSRASFALLELSGPLIYTHVELRDYEHAARLFCDVSDDRPLPLIAPSLCLSQVKTLSLGSRPDRAQNSVDRVTLSWSRCPSGVPLPLDAFTFHQCSWDAQSGRDLCQGLFPEIAVTHMLDPERYTATSAWAPQTPTDQTRPLAMPPAGSWTRLSQLVLSNVDYLYRLSPHTVGFGDDLPLESVRIRPLSYNPFEDGFIHDYCRDMLLYLVLTSRTRPAFGNAQITLSVATPIELSLLQAEVDRHRQLFSSDDLDIGGPEVLDFLDRLQLEVSAEASF